MKLNKIVVLSLIVCLVPGMSVFGAGNKESGYTLGFSNSYGGNTYRQTMEALFKKLADQMVADGTLASYKMLEFSKNFY